MTCLICRYFQPIEPAQHKADREAGRCQSDCGTDWTQHTAINHVKNHGALDGWCRLHSKAERYVYNHVCGDISVRSYFLTNWGVKSFEADDNLFEWAEKALGVVIHGSWRTQQHAELTKQNAELKRQLKATRKISASRFKRLQKIEDSKEPERLVDVLPVYAYPHLVAAE